MNETIEAEVAAENWLQSLFGPTWRCRVNVSAGAGAATCSVSNGQVQVSSSVGLSGYTAAEAAMEVAERVWDRWKAVLLQTPVGVELAAWRAWHKQYDRALKGHQVDALDQWEALCAARQKTDFVRMMDAPDGIEPDSSGGRVV